MKPRTCESISATALCRRWHVEGLRHWQGKALGAPKRQESSGRTAMGRTTFLARMSTALTVSSWHCHVQRFFENQYQIT